MVSAQPSAGFKFNTFEEIKSHSSVLFNERMAILFYLLDMKSIELNTSPSVGMLLEVRSVLKQIYKNMRSLLYYNPLCRATLNIQTKDPGIYVTDIMIGMIDGMIQYCEINQYTIKSLFILTQELNNFEMIIKNILQYFHYFIRPDFRHKPDIEVATEKYKEIADTKTIEELREIIGTQNIIDFENLGINKIDSVPKGVESNDIEDQQYDEDDQVDVEDVEEKDGTKVA